MWHKESICARNMSHLFLTWQDSACSEENKELKFHINRNLFFTPVLQDYLDNCFRKKLAAAEINFKFENKLPSVDALPLCISWKTVPLP